MDQKILQGDERARFADYLQNRVTVVRAVLPKKTDLNRYFEIMNTRGQQLQQVDIVKARLMALLDSGAEQACFAWVWEACADMDSYVQMSLTRGDTEARKALFDDDWAWLRVSSFDELLAAHHKRVTQANEANTFEFADAALTLDGALLKYATAGVASLSEDPENVRFRSTIEFPAFLLHVLKVWRGDDSADEGGLDDKKLIERFATEFDRRTTDESTLRGKVREFLVLLLRCRNYFDAYVLKRQFTAANVDEGDWSLQRLVKGKVPPGRKTASPRYINTATLAAVEAEDDGEVDPATNDLLLIESMLRVRNRCSIAHSRPARSTAPFPVTSSPRTRTLVSDTSGAMLRTIPAQAVPCPDASPSSSSTTLRPPLSSGTTATARSMQPTAGCAASTPLSTIATVTPVPVEPSNAHSRVSRQGQSGGASVFSRPEARLQAGRSSSGTGGSYATNAAPIRESHVALAGEPDRAGRDRHEPVPGERCDGVGVEVRQGSRRRRDPA